MSVLFLDQFNELGGAQQCLLDLIDGMEPDRVYAAVPGSGPLALALRRRGVTVYELPLFGYSHGRKTAADVLRFALNVPRLAPRIRSIMTSRGIDIAYVNGPRLLLAAATAAPEKLIFHAHNLLDKKYSAALARWSLRRTNAHVIASSKFVATPLPQQRLNIIYNGVPEIPFRAPQAAAGRPWRIGLIGRIAPEKGQIDFVRAARLLFDRGVDAEYRVHGAPMFADTSYFDSVRELSRGLPIAFPGWSESVAAVLAELDVVVAPSSTIDATPRVIMESFSAGVPVVAYRSGGIPELIEDGVSGVLAPARSPKALADSIEALLSDGDRVRNIARAARKRWETRFTVQRYVREVQDLLATVRRGSKAPPQLQTATQR